MALKPLVGQDLLIIEASRSHSDTPQSVEIHQTSDRPDAETSTGQHTAVTGDNHALAWFEPKIPASERPQTHALNLAATGIGTSRHSLDIPLKRKSYQIYLHFSQFIFHFHLSLLQCMNVRKFTAFKNERTKSSNSTALHTIPVFGINVFRILPWTKLLCHISVSVYWNVHSRVNKWTDSFLCKSYLIFCCREWIWLCSIRTCKISAVSFQSMHYLVTFQSNIRR
jgi:hypothetical protein